MSKKQLTPVQKFHKSKQREATAAAKLEREQRLANWYARNGGAPKPKTAGLHDESGLKTRRTSNRSRNILKRMRSVAAAQRAYKNRHHTEVPPTKYDYFAAPGYKHAIVQKV